MGRAVGSGPATLLLPSTTHWGWCCHFPALPCLPFAPASRGHRLVPGSPGGEDGVRRQLGPCCTHEVWVVGGDGGATLILKHSDATLHGKVWWPQGFPSPSSTKPCSSPPPLDPTPSPGVWGEELCSSEPPALRTARQQPQHLHTCRQVPAAPPRQAFQADPAGRDRSFHHPGRVLAVLGGWAGQTPWGGADCPPRNASWGRASCFLPHFQAVSLL